MWFACHNLYFMREAVCVCGGDFLSCHISFILWKTPNMDDLQTELYKESLISVSFSLFLIVTSNNENKN